MNKIIKWKDSINTYTYKSQTGKGATLGNVRVMLSDVKMPEDISTNRLTVSYQADILNVNNYDPYGKPIEEQSWTKDMPSLFGYNGMLKDNHIAGEGNAYYTLFREYDPTINK